MSILAAAERWRIDLPAAVVRVDRIEVDRLGDMVPG
jgi:hypothetical protein